MPPTKKNLHPWDQACLKILHRNNPVDGQTEALDRGVNYFILKLESYGAKTRFSCAGHPRGFYISFISPTTLARRIARGGYFTVTVEDLPNEFAIRLTGNERAGGAKWSELDKCRCLRGAAEAWEKLATSAREAMQRHRWFARAVAERSSRIGRKF